MKKDKKYTFTIGNSFKEKTLSLSYLEKKYKEYMLKVGKDYVAYYHHNTVNHFLCCQKVQRIKHIL